MSARRAASGNADSSAAAQRASRGRAGSRGATSSSPAPPRSGHAKSDGNGPLLLDTHVWVWLLGGHDALMAPAVPPQIERASQSGSCYVSDISAWEVATKSARQALSLTMDAAAWIDEAVSAPGLNHVAVSREILVASARLPLNSLPDLVDRILVATALRHGLTVVTADESLLAFQVSWPLFRVIDARR